MKLSDTVSGRGLRSLLSLATLVSIGAANAALAGVPCKAPLESELTFEYMYSSRARWQEVQDRIKCTYVAQLKADILRQTTLCQGLPPAPADSREECHAELRRLKAELKQVQMSPVEWDAAEQTARPDPEEEAKLEAEAELRREAQVRKAKIAAAIAAARAQATEASQKATEQFVKKAQEWTGQTESESPPNTEPKHEAAPTWEL